MAATNEEEDINIQCRGTSLEQVSQFKYLGVLITSDCNCGREIYARLGAARSAISSLSTLWKDRALSRSIKLRLLKSLVWPIATYGAESWTLKKDSIKKLEAFEMYGYRRILRVSWTEHRTNHSILEELRTTRQLVATIKRRKLQYFGHVTRAEKLSALILQGKIEGRRLRGRPRRRWQDDVMEWTKRSMAECTSAARGRERWRKVVTSAMISDLQAHEDGPR